MKKQFKKILALILVILFITLTPIMSYLNIENNVYATTVITGIGIKLVATILASMGVLKFVNENIGMDEFYQGFLEWVEDVKGILDLPQQLIQIATTAISTSAKMKITSVKDYIMEYYNTITQAIMDEIPDFDIIEDAKGIITYVETGLIPWILGTNETYNIGNGYELFIYGNTSRRTSEEIYSLGFNYGIKFNGNIVTSTSNTYDGFDIFSYPRNSDVKVIYQLQSSINKIILDIIVYDYTGNSTKSNTVSVQFDDLVAISDIPNITTLTPDIPIAKSVPIGLTMPWDLNINTEDVVGLNIEQLLQVINNSQLEEYLDRLLDLPKSIVDSMNPPVIGVEEGVITGVTETTWDDALPDIKEQTDILTQIRDRIDVMTDSIDKFLNPANNPPNDDNGTDWGNFKGFFDIFWIFYYLIIIAILILLKFFSVIMMILSIPANTALFDSYPTMLSGLNYIKNIKVGGFNITLQTIFEYMFTVFFFVFIVTTLQKLYHSFSGIERQTSREEKNIKIDSKDNENTKFTGWGDEK